MLHRNALQLALMAAESQMPELAAKELVVFPPQEPVRALPGQAEQFLRALRIARLVRRSDALPRHNPPRNRPLAGRGSKSRLRRNVRRGCEEQPNVDSAGHRWVLWREPRPKARAPSLACYTK